MGEEVCYVEIGVENFMEKFLPVSGDPFDPSKSDTTLNMTHLDVKESDSRREKACYPDVVSDTAYIFHAW